MKNYTDEQLKALEAWEWVKILKENPELADKYDKWEKLDSWDWCNLLSEQPQLVDRCDKVNGWMKFTSEDWCEFLSNHRILRTNVIK